MTASGSPPIDTGAAVADAPGVKTVKPSRALIPFNTVALYGMERAVIELFDLLRPMVHPHFVMTQTARRENLAVLQEVERRELPHSFFGDSAPWPAIRKPRSFTHLGRLCYAMFRGNLDMLRCISGCDFIYLPGISYSYFCLLALVYCLIARKRVILQFHDIQTKSSWPLRLLNWAVTDYIHNTGVGWRMVRESNPWIARRRNHVIPLHLGPHVIASGRVEGAEVWFGKRVLLFAGQVSVHKGVDLLVRAFNRTAPLYPDAVLLIVGQCAPEFRSELEQLCATEAAPRVHYLGYRGDVASLMSSAYLYVHPTPPSRFTEAFGRGVLEAMACGVPAVCFGSGALQEVVVHERTGLLCESEDVDCLASALNRLLSDGSFRDACGRNARDRYESVYSADRVRSEWASMVSRN